MRVSDNGTSNLFERAVVVLSIDTEQIWGYLDLMTETHFRRRYPDAVATHDRLLDCLCSANISATWTVVGGLSLSESAGARDPRMAGLPPSWLARVSAGDEASAPLWYARSFVTRLLHARPAQDVGLHGGLTHLIWRSPEVTSEVARRELLGGMRALEEIGIRPRSFVYPRDLDAHHHLLAQHGIQVFRGRGPIASERVGLNFAGSVTRLIEELCRFTPPPVWPEEFLPGLWNVPPSLFLYSMRASRSHIAPMRLRLDRVRQGVEVAIRCRGIFHLALHPENLAESDRAFPAFEAITDHLARLRDRGDVEILSMSTVADRVKGGHPAPVAASAGMVD
jgi:hypothetical protein